MNNSFSTPIDNLRIWSGGNWIKCAEKYNLLLRIHYDQLIITSMDKVLESLNTNMKLKGIFKDDVLILIISTDSQEVRKIKFQIKENIQQCLEGLRTRFPVVSYGSVVPKSKVTKKYQKIEDIIKNVMEGEVKLNKSTKPSEYKNFVKLCLFDPMFPQLVLETKNILEEEIIKTI